MTHKEFAAKWRATGRSLGLCTVVFITLMLAPMAVLLWWVQSDRLFRVVEDDPQAQHATLTRNAPNSYTYTYPKLALAHIIAPTRRMMYLSTGLCVIYILLVGLAYFLWVRRHFRRSGILCAGCDRVFVAWDIRHILSGGHCCYCGERVLQDDPPPTL